MSSCSDGLGGGGEVAEFRRSYKRFAAHREEFSPEKRNYDPAYRDTLTTNLVSDFDQSAKPLVAKGRGYFFPIYEQLEREYGPVPTTKEETFGYLSNGR